MTSPGITGILDDPARLDPARPALVLRDEVVTYGDLAAAVEQCSSKFEQVGIRPGSWVPVVDDASLLSVASSLGLASLRCAAALMNPRLSADEIRALVESSGSERTAVAGDNVAGVVLEALGVEPLRSGDLLHPHTGEVSTWESCRGEVSGAVTAAGEADPAVQPGDVGLVLFTSGTTGLPKPVALTQESLRRRIFTFAAPFDPAVEPAISIMCVPLVHIGGMLGLLVQLAAGSTTVVQRRFDAGEWLELVEAHRVSRAFLVPTMLHRILEHPRFAETDLSSLKQIAYGAAPASAELVERAVASLPGVEFSNVFGQTETLGAITSLGPDDHDPGKPGRHLASVGRPLPGVTIRIVDPETCEDLPRGAVGELWASTSYSTGWTRTGDLARQDHDDYVYVMGRIGDTINRGGEKFAPLEVEQVLRSHPMVQDVAVVGIPDTEMGSRVGAAVVSRGELDLAELRAWCRGRLASFKAPEKTVLVDEIPYNETGKVRRRELVEMLSRTGIPSDD